MRVCEFLAEHQIAYEMVLHPPAFTAQKRARFLHIPGHRVAKAVLLRGPEGFVLAVLPATRRVDTEAVARALGGPVRLAVECEIAQQFPDCEWGVVPPFGRAYGIPVLLDASLGDDGSVLFETNTHAEAVRLRAGDFERLEKARRLPLTGDGSQSSRRSAPSYQT